MIGSFFGAGFGVLHPERLKLAARPGVFALTGQDAGGLEDSTLACQSGSFLLTGQDAGLVEASALEARAGAFSLAGQHADFLEAPGLTCQPGVFLLSGQDASLVLIGSVQLAAAILGRNLARGRIRAPAAAGAVTRAPAAAALRRYTVSGTLQ